MQLNTNHHRQYLHHIARLLTEDAQNKIGLLVGFKRSGNNTVVPWGQAMPLTDLPHVDVSRDNFRLVVFKKALVHVSWFVHLQKDIKQIPEKFY